MNQAAQENITPEDISGAFRGIPCLQADAVLGLLKIRDEILDFTEQAIGLLEQADKTAGGIKIYFPHFRISGCETYLSNRAIPAIARDIDRQCWHMLMEYSCLMAYMGQSARRLWKDSLEKKDALELNLGNIEAVFREHYAYRHNLFEQGVKELFRAISWDRSNDLPLQLGKKYIQTSLGGTHRWGTEHLDDLMRIFFVLDGKPEIYRERGILASLNSNCDENNDLKNDYIQVRLYQNGNGHVNFLRPDLVAAANSVIAKLYPDALPPK